MARTKTVSQNIALLSSNTGVGFGPNTYLNIISSDCSWNQEKSDVNTYGALASRERVAVSPPTVSLNFSYYLGGGYNEYLLGLYDSGAGHGEQSALRYILDKTKDEKNYYIFIAPEGADAIGLSGSSSGISIIGIGNGFLNSYSLEAEIGNFPTVSVGVQGLNVRTYTGGMNQQTPAVDSTTGLELTGVTFSIVSIKDNLDVSNESLNPEINVLEPYVLNPGDVSVTLSDSGGLFYDYSSLDIQSVRLGFDLNRKGLDKLGSRFSISREIEFPINVNFEVVSISKDLKLDSLSQFLCSTGLYSANISFKYNQCGTGQHEAFGVTMRNISLEGQQWSTQAGSDPQTVTTTWVGQVGGAGDLSNGLFYSGGWNRWDFTE